MFSWVLDYQKLGTERWGVVIYSEAQITENYFMRCNFVEIGLYMEVITTMKFIMSERFTGPLQSEVKIRCSLFFVQEFF